MNKFITLGRLTDTLKFLFDKSTKHHDDDVKKIIQRLEVLENTLIKKSQKTLTIAENIKVMSKNRSELEKNCKESKDVEFLIRTDEGEICVFSDESRILIANE